MSKVIRHIKTTVLSGVILLVPLFVLALIFKNLYDKLTGLGIQFSRFVGLKSIGSVGAVTIAKILILFALLYGCGLLLKLTMITRVRTWLDTHILQFIPGYIYYKARIEEQLMTKMGQRPPVLVRIGDAERPGFLTDTTAGKCVVFIPSAPDINIGEIWVVDEDCVTRLNATEHSFKSSIMHNGKDLLA